MSDYFHGPNLTQSGWWRGVHWAIAFKCCRCGKTEFRLYDPKSAGDGNIQEQEPADGWSRDLSMLLCPACAESFETWLRETEDNA